MTTKAVQRAIAGAPIPPGAPFVAGAVVQVGDPRSPYSWLGYITAIGERPGDAAAVMVVEPGHASTYGVGDVVDVAPATLRTLRADRWAGA